MSYDQNYGEHPPQPQQYENAPQQSYQQPQQQYQNNKPPYQQNWKGGNSGGGGGWQNKGGFQRKEKPFDNSRGELGQGQFPIVEEPILYLPFAVTGNKDVPPEVIEAVGRIVRKLEEVGYTARSGGMEGLEAEATKAAIKCEIHLPWKDFAQMQSKLTFNSPLAKGIAKKFMSGGNWETLKPPAQAFLAKNVRILTGQNCDSLAMFLLCWSRDGAETSVEKTFDTGSVGHAIAIANAHRIPVFNLGKSGAENRLYAFLGIQ